MMYKREGEAVSDSFLLICTGACKEIISIAARVHYIMTNAKKKILQHQLF